MNSCHSNQSAFPFSFQSFTLSFVLIPPSDVRTVCLYKQWRSSIDGQILNLVKILMIIIHCRKYLFIVKIK
ncbi:hypothetical protein Peur_070200 [Populus x canadensis]